MVVLLGPGEHRIAFPTGSSRLKIIQDSLLFRDAVAVVVAGGVKVREHRGVP